MTGRRVRARVVATALATVVVAVVTAAWAAPASATAYRYWSYWHGTSAGGWTFSQVGATYRPAAGSVDGWRFAVSGAAGSVRPRAASTFSSICGSHAPAPSGQKLVGLVVDYGTSSDAPPGEHPPRGIDTFCAQVAESGTSAQVLVSYASVRSQSGLVCAVDGYPAHECGAVVTPSPTPKPTPRPSTGSPSSHASSAAAAPSRTRVGTTATDSRAASAAASAAASSATGTPSAQDASGAPSAVAVGSGGAPPPSDGGSSPPVGALAGAALVLAVGAAAVVRARRGRPPSGRTAEQA
jgi:hypothetical protein